MGLNSDIRKAVFDRLIDNGITNVAHPNVSFTETKPFYRISILPAPTTSWSFNGTDILEGFIQIDTIIADGIGEISATDLADAILALFARTLYITEGTTEIGFIQSGWLGPAIQQDAGYFIPATIPYQVINKGA